MRLEVRARELNALRAIAEARAGLDIDAYPSTMSTLVRMGLAKEEATASISHPQGRAWFLTTKGRAVLRAYRADKG